MEKQSFEVETKEPFQVVGTTVYQLEFDAAVMAAVEKYLQVRMKLVNQYDSHYHRSSVRACVELDNTLFQTTFSSSDT